MPPADDLSFAERQRAFVERLSRTGLAGLERGTIVVCQSLSFPIEEARKIVGIERYEERLLCALLLLRDPDVRIVYVTAMPVAPEVIDYYLSFVDEPTARERLTLITVGERGPRPLAEKLLAAPEVVDEIRDAVDPVDSYLLPFNVTVLEEGLADSLGIPLYGPELSLVHLGSKSGARRIARQAGVPVLDGDEDVRSEFAMAHALAALRARRSDARSAVMKLNNGFSGQGNAIVNLDDMREHLRETPTVFCASEESWESYAAKIEAEGAVVEELVRGAEIASPSVQMRIAPGGEYEIVSTHDQILGGPDDQVYLGCRFPARADYLKEIQELAARVGGALAERGVIGNFGMDFIVVPRGRQRGIYLSEINLRFGGTTHPFMMARLATEGTYDVDTGTLRVDDGIRHYAATDNLKSDAFKNLSPAQVIAALEADGLAFDRPSKTGVILHLLGAMEEYGKLGALCVAPGPEAAAELAREFETFMEKLSTD